MLNRQLLHFVKGSKHPIGSLVENRYHYLPVYCISIKQMLAYIVGSTAAVQGTYNNNCKCCNSFFDFSIHHNEVVGALLQL